MDCLTSCNTDSCVSAVFTTTKGDNARPKSPSTLARNVFVCETKFARICCHILASSSSTISLLPLPMATRQTLYFPVFYKFSNQGIDACKVRLHFLKTCCSIG